MNNTRAQAKARKLLNDLFEFFSETINHTNVDAGAHLWDVLTALRGPDSNNYDVKCNTTAQVRGALFEFAGAEPKSSYVNVFPFLQENKSTDRSSHFTYHYTAALIGMRALGVLGENDRVVPYTRPRRKRPIK